MFDLTPGERRGALTLVVLLLLGTAHDLWQARQPPQGLPVGLAPPMRASGPAAPESAASGPAAATPQRALDPIDLNRATAAELDALPGIGPVLASRILAQRGRLGRFHSREDLLSVPGIGPKLYARLAPLVRVGPASGVSGQGAADARTRAADQRIR